MIDLPALRVRPNRLQGSRNWLPPVLPAQLRGRSGLIQWRATLDDGIGQERVIFIFDDSTFVFDLAHLQPFVFHLKSRLIATSHGPVLSLLFWLSNPHGPDPFSMWDVTLNPYDPRLVLPYWQLAHQSHWHVFVLGFADEVLNMFEIENDFELPSTLRAVVEACAGSSPGDFQLAKAEYEATYTLRDLFTLES
jgi:hypothetical protein